MPPHLLPALSTFISNASKMSRPLWTFPPPSANLSNLNADNLLSGSVPVARLTTPLTTPPPIGGTTPAAGSFTSLDASGTITQMQALAAATADGVCVKTTTPATVGAQKWSPSVTWESNGWGTTAPASAAVKFRAYVVPTQGTTPTGELIFESKIGSGAWTQVFRVTHDGIIYGTSTNFTAHYGASIYALGSGVYCGIAGGAAPMLKTLNATDIIIGPNSTAALTAKHTTLQVQLASTLKLASYTVATLPSASTAGAGAMALVTDAAGASFLGSATGGSSTKVTVVSDGSAWKCM